MDYDALRCGMTRHDNDGVALLWAVQHRNERREDVGTQEFETEAAAWREFQSCAEAELPCELMRRTVNEWVQVMAYGW